MIGSLESLNLANIVSGFADDIVCLATIDNTFTLLLNRCTPKAFVTFSPFSLKSGTVLKSISISLSAYSSKEMSFLSLNGSVSSLSVSSSAILFNPC